MTVVTVKPAAEILSELESERVKPDNEWKYLPNNTLVHKTNRYEVDLDRCESSAAVLDWIFQVFRKGWCTPKTMHDLLIHIQKHVNPQATLCSFGIERGKYGKNQIR